jgi:hypothetical protein
MAIAIAPRIPRTSRLPLPSQDVAFDHILDTRLLHYVYHPGAMGHTVGDERGDNATQIRIQIYFSADKTLHSNTLFKYFSAKPGSDCRSLIVRDGIVPLVLY